MLTSIFTTGFKLCCKLTANLQLHFPNKELCGGSRCAHSEDLCWLSRRTNSYIVSNIHDFLHGIGG